MSGKANKVRFWDMNREEIAADEAAQAEAREREAAPVTAKKKPAAKSKKSGR